MLNEKSKCPNCKNKRFLHRVDYIAPGVWNCYKCGHVFNPDRYRICIPTRGFLYVSTVRKLEMLY